MDVRQGLRGGKAGEEETEEGVGVGVEADLSVERSGGAGRIEGMGRIRGIRRIGSVGVGRAGVGACKTFVVNADVHGLDGAERGIDKEGDGHGVEESGR